MTKTNEALTVTSEVSTEQGGVLGPEISSVVNIPNSPERLRSFLRIIVGGCLLALLIGDIALYSLYKATKAHLDSQEHRIGRLDNLLDNMVVSNENALRIEQIEQKVNGIEGQISDLTMALKAQNEEDQAIPSKRK